MSLTLTETPKTCFVTTMPKLLQRYLQFYPKGHVLILAAPLNPHKHNALFTRDVLYVRREVDLMKTAKVNAYIMHIFGKIELLSIHAT